MARLNGSTTENFQITSGAIDFQSAYTLAFWFQWKVDSGGFEVIFTVQRAGADRYDTFESGTTGFDSGVHMVADPQGTFEDTNIGFNLVLNTWYYIAITRNGGTLKGYIIEADGTVHTATRANTTAHNVASDTISLGWDGGFSEGTDGNYQYIKAWTRELTQAELLAEMQAIRPLDPTSLYGFWPVFPGSGERARDYSGNGHSWTENGTITDEDPPSISWGMNPMSAPFVAAGGVTLTVNIGPDTTFQNGVRIYP